MKKLITLAALLSLTTIGWAGSSREEAYDRLDHAGKVLHEIMAAPDKGIPEEVLEHAKCVAVVPHLIKGGFVFGAENGKGVATCRTDKGWSAPSFFAITGGSWGLQIGAEGVDLVLIIQNDKGMERLTGSKFELGADASAAASGSPRFSQHGLEARRRNSNLLAGQRCVCRAHAQWGSHSAGRRLH
jgi:lipid-binding SYLF domain-containing protein